MSTSVFRALLILAGFVACLITTISLQGVFGVSVTRATSLLCVIWAAWAGCNYLVTKSPWLRRIAIACLVTALIIWLMNSNMA